MFRLFLHAMHIERLSDQDAHDLIQQHMGSFPDTSAEAARSRLEKLTRQQNELQTHANKITETEIIKKILVGKLSFIALAPQHRANFLNILRLEESRHLVFCADEAQNRVGYFLRCYKHRTLPATTPQNEDAKSTEITPKRISLPSRVERLITSFLIGADSENLPHTNARVTPTAVCLEEAEKTSSVSRLFISECTRILQMAEEVSLYLDTPSEDSSHNRRALVSHCMARGAESSMVG